MKVKKMLLREETEKVLHTKSNGDKLVVASSGDGYTAFTRDNVHIGHISAETDAASVAEFSKKEPKYESMNDIPAGWKKDENTRMKHVTEDYLDSAEYRIQRYEDDIQELFPRVHDGYMRGMVNSKSYAEALAHIYSVLEELDYVDMEEGLIGDINVNLDASGSSVGFLGGTAQTTNEKLHDEELTESKTGYSYGNYIICYGCKGTDRWYVKDGNNEFVGNKSGYSTEKDAQEYVDEFNESLNSYDDDFDDLSSFDNCDEVRRADRLYGVERKSQLEEGCAEWKDTTGCLGVVGETYTTSDLRRLWEEGRYNDPSMAQYKGDYNAWVRDTLAQMEKQEADIYESLPESEIKVGSIVTYVDDNPPTRGTVVKCSGDIATVQVGDPSNKDYVDIPVNKLQLDESFGYRLNLEDIEWRVASLLDVDALGEDNWIEYSQGDVYGLMGSNEYGCSFEAIGPEDLPRRGSLRTSNGSVRVLFRNGSEANCNSAEEIARFIAGEFGISI